MTRKAEIINELKQIEARSAELEAGVETADQAELEARTKEAEELATRQKALKDELQKIEAEEKAAADFAQKRSGVDITPKKEKTMNKIDEIRNSKAYIDAYAKFIKTGEVEEVRSILTTNADNQYVTNADGQLPVPEFVQTTINTAWSSNELFNMIKQTAVKGNLKIGFELSATDARSIGISAPVRESGDLAGSAACKLIGPAGEIDLAEGVIVAKRHIHMTPEDARSFGVRDKEIVKVKIDGTGRALIFDDVVVRVSASYSTAMHIDTDESNACGGANQGEIVK